MSPGGGLVLRGPWLEHCFLLAVLIPQRHGHLCPQPPHWTRARAQGSQVPWGRCSRRLSMCCGSTAPGQVWGSGPHPSVEGAPGEAMPGLRAFIVLCFIMSFIMSSRL